MAPVSRPVSPCLGLMLVSVSTTTLASAPPEPELAAFRALDSTTPGASVNAEGAPAASLAALRELSGLTWNQLARLFGVSRRAVHFWAEGRPLTPSHEEQLQRLLAVVQELDRGTPRANRALLLVARPGEPMVFDLLAAARSSRNDGGDLAEGEFAGVVVVTQTCVGVFRPIVTAVSEMV